MGWELCWLERTGGAKKAKGSPLESPEATSPADLGTLGLENLERIDRLFKLLIVSSFGAAALGD